MSEELKCPDCGKNVQKRGNFIWHPIYDGGCTLYNQWFTQRVWNTLISEKDFLETGDARETALHIFDAERKRLTAELAAMTVLQELTEADALEGFRAFKEQIATLTAERDRMKVENSELDTIARELLIVQDFYRTNGGGGENHFPAGNSFYDDWMMKIVRRARAALEDK